MASSKFATKGDGKSIGTGICITFLGILMWTLRCLRNWGIFCTDTIFRNVSCVFTEPVGFGSENSGFEFLIWTAYFSRIVSPLISWIFSPAL